jgi:hypothetical protein
LAAIEHLGIEPAALRTLLERGIGSQASLHFYDSPTTFDLSLPALVADLLGTADRAELNELGLLYELGLFAGTLSCPAYVAVPLRDTEVVDRFLTQLDAGLSRQVPTWRDRLLGTSLQGEYYRLTTKSETVARVLGLRAGPARYRVFWARIGDGLYFANQPGILDDLHAAHDRRGKSASSDRGPVAHAMLRLRAAHWSQALTGYRLGWEEANREACMRNLALLSSAARAFSYTPPVTSTAVDQETRQEHVLQLAARLHGCDFACPDGGRYRLADDGRSFTCDVHGSLAHPRQSEQPARRSEAERLADVTATVTLTRDSLRLVVILSSR